MPLVIQLIAGLTFMGVIGAIVRVSLGRAASLEHDPSIDAVLGVEADRPPHRVAV